MASTTFATSTPTTCGSCGSFDMLSRVKIQNFKSIGEPGVDLEFKPLTLLVGPNGGAI